MTHKAGDMPSTPYVRAVVIAAVVGMAGSAALAQIPVYEIAKTHQEAKATLDPVLPKRVDGVTVLTGVRADGITLTFELRVERDKASLAPEFDDALGQKAAAMVCGNERNRKVMQAGGRYGFEYRDKFDQQLLSVTVGKDDCI